MKKEFDCVEMKHQIQEKLLAERRGMTPEQEREHQVKEILANPILGPIWKRARRVSTPAAPSHGNHH